MLDNFCRRYHFKKAHILEEIIQEGIQKKIETLELAESIGRGLEQEKEGAFSTTEEVAREIFRKRKIG